MLSRYPYLNTQQSSPGYASQKRRDVNPGFFPDLVSLIRVGLQREEIKSKKVLPCNWNNSNPSLGAVFALKDKRCQLEQWMQVLEQESFIPNWKVWTEDYWLMLKYPLLIHVLMCFGTY